LEERVDLGGRAVADEGSCGVAKGRLESAIEGSEEALRMLH